jgi:hypothetical protein
MNKTSKRKKIGDCEVEVCEHTTLPYEERFSAQVVKPYESVCCHASSEEEAVKKALGVG